MSQMSEPLEFQKICYDIHGKAVEETDPNVCAKLLVSNRTGNTFYVIKQCSKGVFDPTITNSSYKKEPWKFLKVDEHKFNAYINYLYTKQRRYLTQVERSI